ncbi:MAG: T9SS type A sorting domain-containing protein [Chitinispirillaceae bacterium]|nr:T9SS type A sorting domain-containing protein [Chitinispirillaceae bacterium]
MKFPPFITIAALLLTFNAVVSAQYSGKITYTLYRASNPTQAQLDAYARIQKAMDSALGYYNKYTPLTKALKVYYDPNVPTAQASFAGTISFGAISSMVVHTAMHEMAHTFGIGTTSQWGSRVQNRVFTGTNATRMLRQIMNDPDTVLNADNMHFWPYGLNYAREVRSYQDLIDHCKMVTAIYTDLFGPVEIVGGPINGGRINDPIRIVNGCLVLNRSLLGKGIPAGVTITDLRGRRVVPEPVKATGNHIKIDGLARGVYVLKLYAGKQAVNRPFVVE